MPKGLKLLRVQSGFEFRNKNVRAVLVKIFGDGVESGLHSGSETFAKLGDAPIIPQNPALAHGS